MDRHYYPSWFQYSWPEFRIRGKRKRPAPHGFVVSKGSTHMAVTHQFVEFALNDRRAQDLLHWMSNINVPDEHFFQTLSHSPQLGVPGSYKGC